MQVLQLFFAETMEQITRNCQLLKFQPDYGMDTLKTLFLNSLPEKNNIAWNLIVTVVCIYNSK